MTTKLDAISTKFDDLRADLSKLPGDVANALNLRLQGDIQTLQSLVQQQAADHAKLQTDYDTVRVERDVLRMERDQAAASLASERTAAEALRQQIAQTAPKTPPADAPVITPPAAESAPNPTIVETGVKP